MYDSITEAMDAIDEELNWFQWAYPDRGENHGELAVDRDTERLVLIVWVADNETPEDEEVKPLHVSQAITDEDAQVQIRSIIHNYLCHEADEQMWFGKEGKRVFYPH
jgi:hypothetical protein